MQMFPFATFNFGRLLSQAER